MGGFFVYMLNLRVWRFEGGGIHNAEHPSQEGCSVEGYDPGRTRTYNQLIKSQLLCH